MNKDELRQCQLRQLEALKFIDYVCNENHLQYYAHTGTLLGAIRHNGYIPWDMDTDILMSQEDSQKFIQIVNEMHSQIYSIIREEDSWASSDRLIMKTVLCYGDAANREEDRYIHIDIYSYGNAKQHPVLIGKYYDINSRLMHRLIEYREGRTLFKSTFNRNLIKIMDILYRRYSNQQLREKLKSNAVTEGKSEYITVYNSFYGYAKETYPREYYEKREMVPFEDMTIPVPAHYNEILSRLYGNWKQLPPIEERYPSYIEDMVYEEITIP